MRQKLSPTRLFKISRYLLFNAIVIAVCFSILYFLDNNFKVREIQISGLKNKTSLIGLKDINEKNLLLLSPDEMEKELLLQNPIIKQITVKKLYPNKLLFTVVTNKPAAYFITDQGYFLLGEDGRILGKFRNEPKNQNIPTIHYYQKINYSSWSSGDFLTYRDILSALHFLKTSIDLGLTIDTIDINGLNMIALQMKEKKILFTTEKEESLEDYQFATIIRQFKIEGKDFAVLDLRFDKPVVQFK